MYSHWTRKFLFKYLINNRQAHLIDLLHKSISTRHSQNDAYLKEIGPQLCKHMRILSLFMLRRFAQSFAIIISSVLTSANEVFFFLFNTFACFKSYEALRSATVAPTFETSAKYALSAFRLW